MKLVVCSRLAQVQVLQDVGAVRKVLRGQVVEQTMALVARRGHREQLGCIHSVDHLE